MSPVPVFAARPLDARASELLSEYPADLFTERLHRSIELTHRYALELSVQVLDRLGLRPHLRVWQGVDELSERCSLQPGFRTALRWLLEQGGALGWLETDSALAPASPARRYRIADTSWSPDLAQLRSAALAMGAGNAATLDLLDHAASIYPAVARGELSADRALLAPETIELWLTYFDNVNPAYAVNNWVGGFAAASRLANRSRFTVLEVGAGAGSGTDVLLRLLEERGLAPALARYVVSEPGAFFRRRAERTLRRRFPELPLAFQTLDINEPWESQGISRGSVDLVYAINVMHVARDLRYSLSEARSALVEGGWLVLGECLQSCPRKPIFPELIFQLLETYTDVRPESGFRSTAGFLSAREWLGAFENAGFAMQSVEPDMERITQVCPNFLSGAVCGQKPGVS
jgi:SAM-dependent methyltransferase